MFKKCVIAIVILSLILGGISTAAVHQKQAIVLRDGLTACTNVSSVSNDDFYFVQITDPHIRFPLFDKIHFFNGEKLDSKEKFETVINYVISFEPKPAFVVITGDVVDWASGNSGILNCLTFVGCLHKEDNQLYADEACSIPVYVIPGNHDYRRTTSLSNYYQYIDPNHSVRNNKFTVTHQNVCLFFLDSGHDYILQPKDWIKVQGSGLWSWDIKWLRDELENCNAEHKIILMHHPAVNWFVNLFKKDVIHRNRRTFIRLCDDYDVELVLAGHTHKARVFSTENFIPKHYCNEILPLNCSQYSSLYVQTASCVEDWAYRNISVKSNHVWLEKCEYVNS
ncbi:putative phosphohydrolase [Thermoplasmatales archaeon SCGC AB-539-N05]|nr:putative phosphohydrolase [Thermoplasmatales archaeon SCGC AB-539-N05]